MEAARQKLQAGDTAQALALAQEARRSDPSSYKAAYYIAYALMTMGDLEGASEAQKRSLQLAQSDDQKAAVAALSSAISARGTVREAEKAAEAGLDAKAARLYKSAFDAGSPDADVALKAAQIFERRLNDVGSAVSLLRAVQARFPGTAAATTAAAEMARLRPALAATAQEKLNVALQRPAGTRRPFLDDALSVDPSNPDVLVSIANETALNSADWPGMESAIKSLLQARVLEGAMRSGQLRLGAWQSDGRLRDLLQDAWGAQTVEQAMRRPSKSLIGAGLESAEAGVAVIKTLTSGGPAEKAGVQVGDHIISVGGVRVGGHRAFLGIVARLPSNLPTALEVQRGGQSRTLFVVPAIGPSSQGDCEVVGQIDVVYRGGCLDGFAEGPGRYTWKTAEGHDGVQVGSFSGGLITGKSTVTITGPKGSVSYEHFDGKYVK